METATTERLAKLLAARNDALGELTELDHTPLRKLRPTERVRVSVASDTFREADRRIVAELVDLDGPASVGGVVLHLTHDRLNFVSLEPGTGRPIYMSPSAKGWRASLYRYPTAAARQNRPEMVP